MLFLIYYLNLVVLWNSIVAYISRGRKETGQKYKSAFGQLSGEVASEDATFHEMLSTQTESGPCRLYLYKPARKGLSTF